MTSLTPKAQQLINSARIGTPTAVYKPNTGCGVILWLLVIIAFSAFLIFSQMLFSNNAPFPPSDTTFQIFRIGFIGIPLLVVVGALFGLVKTIGNRHSRAVICTHGIACITTKRADAARWEDILTIVHGINVTTTRHQMQGGGSYTTTNVSHQFTVHCYDGRKILFDSTSCGKVEELGETIQVELARRGLPKGARA